MPRRKIEAEPTVTLKNILNYLARIDLRCKNCFYIRTEKCTFEGQGERAEDVPCADGLLFQLFKADVLLKMGETTILKPIRFLSSNKTKNEIMQTFGLSGQETEQIIIAIKNRSIHKEEKTIAHAIPQKEESPELKTAAETLLKDPALIENFITHQNRVLVLDETVRRLLLFACVSAYGDYPINVGLIQVFSSGKTTTSIKTAQYFKNVWFLGSLSPKSLIHEKGEFNEEKTAFIIDLQKKILLFLDEPQVETLQMLKPLLSHDKFETEYRYVDKQSGVTVTAILRGWPCAIFCATQSRYVMELCSRWFTASPETSTEKIKKVILAKGRKASETTTINAEFATWQKAFSMLADEAPFKTVIPYAATLSECFRAKKPVDMRYFDLFLALVKASTILHAHQRTKNEQGNLIATMNDYEESYKVFHQIERATTLGLGQNVIDFFVKVITPLWNEQQVISSESGPSLEIEALLVKYQEVFEEPISRGTLREHFLQPLENKGLIDVEENPDDRRRKMITVKATLPESSLIDNKKFKELLQGARGGFGIL